jgi:hypothetical protein
MRSGHGRRGRGAAAALLGALLLWSLPVPVLAASSPTPTPAPDPIPTVDPSASPSPNPSPSVAPSVPPSPTAGATPSPSASAAPSPSPPSPSPSPSPSPTPRTALPAPGPAVSVLSSDSLQITGLRSLAVTAVPSATGPVKVIELTMDDSTIQGLDLLGPCSGGVRLETTAGREVAGGGLTIDATALQITVLGVPVVLAAADLPEGSLTLPGVSLPPLPTNTVFLSVRMYVLRIDAGSLALDGLRVGSTAC